MSTIEITRVVDVREGDVVTMRDDKGGHYEGPVHEAMGIVFFGPRDYGSSLCASGWTFVRATREVPELPTEAGSVIVLADGQRAVCDPDQGWFTEHNWFGSDSIEPGWRPVGNIFRPEAAGPVR